MIITTKRFTLQPADMLEAHALRDAMDMAIDSGDSQNPAAIPELNQARATLGNLGGWARKNGTPIPVELGHDALELLAMGLRVLADWIDDPDYQADPEALSSSQVRELAGVIDAWVLTSATVPAGVPA